MRDDIKRKRREGKEAPKRPVEDEGVTPPAEPVVGDEADERRAREEALKRITEGKDLF
jgi:hypothetical protein